MSADGPVSPRQKTLEAQPLHAQDIGFIDGVPLVARGNWVHVEVADAANQRCMQLTVNADREPIVHELRFAGGRYLVVVVGTGLMPTGVRVWDFETGGWSWQLMPDGDHDTVLYAVHPFEPVIVTAIAAARVGVVDLRTGAVTRALDDGAWDLLELSPSRGWLASASPSHTPATLVIDKAPRPAVRRQVASSVEALAWAGDESALYCGEGDGIVKRSAETLEVMKRFDGLGPAARRIYISRTGETLAALTTEEDVHVCDLTTGARTIVKGATAFAFSPDGQKLFTAGDRGLNAFELPSRRSPSGPR